MKNTIYWLSYEVLKFWDEMLVFTLINLAAQTFDLVL
jgi:hypothetical protein